MNAPGRRWTEEETKLALYLYFQLPFGQLHARNPEIQKLAQILNRPSNSVAMQLCNFASLDPKITSSGRKGLKGASAQPMKILKRLTPARCRKV
jgi:putative restriction endonuclease